MSVISFPAQSVSLGSEDTFYLDTSFVVDGLALGSNCTSFLRHVAGHALFISPLVWAEAVHVLTRSYVTDDLKKAMAGKLGGSMRPEAASAILDYLLRSGARDGSLRVAGAPGALLKARSENVRGMLLPYQELAVASVESFIAESGAALLTVDEVSLSLASRTCGNSPCDTYDALHLALAVQAGCSYGVTKDADWATIPADMRPAIVRVA